MLKKISALALVLIFALMSWGCGPDTDPILTVEGIPFTAGQYLVFQLESYNTIATRMSYTFNQKDENGDLPSVARQMEYYNNIDGRKVGEWIVRNAVEKLRITIYQDRFMEEHGLKLTDSEYADTLEYAQKTFDFYEDGSDRYYSRNGIGVESLTFWLLSNLKEKKIFTYLYDTGGEKEVPEQDIIDKFHEEYGYAKIFGVPYYDVSTGVRFSDGEIADIEKYLNEAAARISSGKATIDEINTELARSTGNIGPEDVMSPLVPQFFELDTCTYTGKMVSTYLSLDFGQAGYDRDDNYGFFYLFQKEDAYDDYYDDYRYASLYKLKGQEYLDAAGDVTETYKVDFNVKMMNKYEPGNIQRINESEFE